MPKPRFIVFLIASITPAIAYRLGGVSLWTAYAAGMTIAAAIAAFVLWQDELLRDVMVPKGLDLSTGVLAAGVLYMAIVLFFNQFVAPAGELGGLLRRCTLDGPRLPRLEPRGFTRVLEWIRVSTCHGYAHSLGLTGPLRGVLIVLIAALEEIAWRGGVQQALAGKFGPTRGWLLTTVLFAAAQMGTGQPLLVALALVGGLLWGGLYRFRGRLAPAIFSHAVFSYFLFYARPLVDFR